MYIHYIQFVTTPISHYLCTCQTGGITRVLFAGRFPMYIFLWGGNGGGSPMLHVDGNITVKPTFLYVSFTFRWLLYSIERKANGMHMQHN